MNEAERLRTEPQRGNAISGQTAPPSGQHELFTGSDGGRSELLSQRVPMIWHLILWQKVSQFQHIQAVRPLLTPPSPCLPPRRLHATLHPLHMIFCTATFSCCTTHPSIILFSLYLLLFVWLYIYRHNNQVEAQGTKNFIAQYFAHFFSSESF